MCSYRVNLGVRAAGHERVWLRRTGTETLKIGALSKRRKLTLGFWLVASYPVVQDEESTGSPTLVFRTEPSA